MKKLFLILMIVSLIPMNLAQIDELNLEVQEALEVDLNLCEDLIEKTRAVNGATVPSFIPYKNERINIYNPENVLVGHIKTEQGIVSSIDCEELEEPTLVAKIIDLSVIDEILDSENPLKELNNRIGNDIILDAQGFIRSAKLIFAKLSINIASLF